MKHALSAYDLSNRKVWPLPNSSPCQIVIFILPVFYLSLLSRSNLYAEGKVCLSLLGTWSGPGWVPGTSTLSQVLLSIQGQILVRGHLENLEVDEHNVIVFTPP